MQYTSMSALSIDIFGTNAHNLNASAIYDHVYERGKWKNECQRHLVTDVEVHVCAIYFGIKAFHAAYVNAI